MESVEVDRETMYVSPKFINKLSKCCKEKKVCECCGGKAVEIIGFDFIITGKDPDRQKKCVEFDLVCGNCGQRFCGPVMFSQVGRTIAQDGMSKEQREEADELYEQDTK